MFRTGSCEHPTSWAVGGMGKCRPPALSPPERALSNPCPSGTLPAAGKSFKLVLLCWVSAGSTQHACHPLATGVLASQSAPTLPVSSPINHKSLVQCGFVFQNRSPGPGVQDSRALIPCLLRSSPSLVGWDVGRAWVLIDQFCHFVFLYVGFSSPGTDGLSCHLKVIFRFG